MKSNTLLAYSIGTKTLFSGGCRAFCRQILGQLQKAKDAVLDEFRELLPTQGHLLQLALNEAEALAWQSGVPHLVFPTLAMEKAQAVAAWHGRQSSLQTALVA